MHPSQALVAVFMPSLVSLLVRAETDKGAPLTHDEVISIRNRAVVVMVPVSNARAIVDSRGYADLDPENCWEQWSAMRSELLGDN